MNESDSNGYNPSDNFIVNILLSIGFLIKTEKQNILDKLLNKKKIQYLISNNIKMYLDTYIFYNGKKCLGKMFNEYVDNPKNVKIMINQLIRENKIKNILKNEN